ncbi:sensor histidine kinase [Catenovulum sp. SX2]|uniref:sensor histidine kinase n=1 Tax=Catenovulum sp. SX2 TaxID=3398614 RepID=UPI003F87D989
MFNSLAARLSLLFGLLFLLFSAFAFNWYVSSSQTFSHEVKQQLHHELAHHLIHDSLDLQNGIINKADLKQVFHTQMLLGPEWEFYATDANGNILAYSAPDDVVKLKQIDLAPIKLFLAGQQYPIYGSDPRTPGKSKIFSAAPIYTPQGDLTGYLYVVIGGQKFTGLVDILSASQVLQNSLIILLLSLLFAAIVLALIIHIVSRPVRQVSQQLHSFVDSRFSQLPQQQKHWFSSDEIVLLQQDIQLAAAHIQQQFSQIKSTEQLRTELLSHISHDFRTPLTALNGYLETWLIAKEQQKSPLLIESAHKNAQQLGQLVEALFELARLENGDIKTHFENINLVELALDVVQRLSFQAQQAKVKINVIAADNSSPMVIADIAKLERILVNLIENAIRHTPENGNIDVVIQVKSEQSIIKIIDSGVGIPDHELEHIFQAKYKASNSKSQQLNAGLGLAIVNHLLKLHNSEIKVASKPQHGSEFSFALPLAQ